MFVVRVAVSWGDVISNDVQKPFEKGRHLNPSYPFPYRPRYAFGMTSEICQLITILELFGDSHIPEGLLHRDVMY